MYICIHVYCYLVIYQFSCIDIGRALLPTRPPRPPPLVPLAGEELQDERLGHQPRDGQELGAGAGLYLSLSLSLYIYIYIYTYICICVCLFVYYMCIYVYTCTVGGTCCIPQFAILRPRVTDLYDIRNIVILYKDLYIYIAQYA